MDGQREMLNDVHAMLNEIHAVLSVQGPRTDVYVQERSRAMDQHKAKVAVRSYGSEYENKQTRMNDLSRDENESCILIIDINFSCRWRCLVPETSRDHS